MKEPSNLILQRYSFEEDSDNLLGLLFLGDQFLCYTLESYSLRIDEGVYSLGIRKGVTPMTKAFRTSDNYSKWFEYFIEILGVGERTHLYFHGANRARDSKGKNLLRGCVAPGDRPYNPTLHKASDLAVTDSAKSMKYLYDKIYYRMGEGEEMSISIYNVF